MALKTVFILKSPYPTSFHIHYLHGTDEYQNTINLKVYYSLFMPPPCSNLILKSLQETETSQSALLTGVPCSGYSYENEEAATDLQMSNSSQFHLSNLLLLTLAERTIKEKSFMPLW